MANNYTDSIVRLVFEDDSFTPGENWVYDGHGYCRMWSNEVSTYTSMLLDITELGLKKALSELDIPELNCGDIDDKDLLESIRVEQYAAEFVYSPEEIFNFFHKKFPSLSSVTVTCLHSCSKPRPAEHGAWIGTAVKTENGIDTFYVDSYSLCERVKDGSLFD